ncbi:MAG: sigma 54-interacting transcriptional regulator [Eubacterium sp.]|nr:sigma 54-interacting transcriptional regulator [Eubacterium sp.]
MSNIKKTADPSIEKLQEDVIHLKRILNSLDIGIVALDAEKKISFFNTAWGNIHGIKENDESLIGTDFREGFPESPMATAMYGKTGSPSEPLHMSYSGAVVLTYYRPITDGKNILGTVSIVRDYNKVRNLSIDIREEQSVESLFENIFNRLKESVFYVDNRLFIEYVNPAFREAFGMHPGEVLRSQQIRQLVQQAFREENLEGFEKKTILKTNSGRDVNVHVFSLPVVNVHHETEGMIMIISDITDIRSLQAEMLLKNSLLEYYEKHLRKIPREMICVAPNFKEAISLALKVAETSVPVYIEGENGVGKELIAQLIHNNSDRAGKPFIAVNCGAIPESLWESEMFGYEAGAFTGANKGGKAGIFELADGGTVFLDEVGELSLNAQVKMLRFLQNMEIQKVGRKAVKKVNVRVISAMNRSLEEMIEKGEFRVDLYYRLNVMSIHVPPLRERSTEIIPLAEHFVELFNQNYGKSTVLSDEVKELLQMQKWPGNVRQLRNVIEHGVVMCEDVILPLHLPHHMIQEKDGQADHAPGKTAEFHFAAENLPEKVRELEERMIRMALEDCGGNKSRAIELLRISRKKFYAKLKEYGIE